MALSNIEIVRLEVGDTEPGFPFLADESYEYYLEKNSNNITRASIDAARAILMQLSTRNSETVDVFSLKNTSADSYRQALELFITNPSLNPLYQNLQGYFGGTSKSDMQANNDNCDNNIVENPTKDRYPLSTGPFSVRWRF